MIILQTKIGMYTLAKDHIEEAGYHLNPVDGTSFKLAFNLVDLISALKKYSVVLVDDDGHAIAASGGENGSNAKSKS